jgi:hypothetical protein
VAYHVTCAVKAGLYLKTILDTSRHELGHVTHVVSKAFSLLSKMTANFKDTSPVKYLCKLFIVSMTIAYLAVTLEFSGLNQ